MLLSSGLSFTMLWIRVIVKYNKKSGWGLGLMGGGSGGGRVMMMVMIIVFGSKNDCTGM